MSDSYARYWPHRNRNGHVSEDVSAYVRRINASLLPNWPEEVLAQWLHRHWNCIDRYAFLGFERFIFTREDWPLDRIPGPEAFADERFCASFSNVVERARGPHDWLARYMLEHGTWTTPIILLENTLGSSLLPRRQAAEGSLPSPGRPSTTLLPDRPPSDR